MAASVLDKLLSVPWQKVQTQLDRIKLLADLDQYDSARLELREGAALGLRRDLRGAEEDYIAIKGEVRLFYSTGSCNSMRVSSGAYDPACHSLLMQPDTAQMVKAAVNSIETLDVALKTREPAGAVRMLAQDAADRIAVVIGGLQARASCIPIPIAQAHEARS